MTRSAVKVWLYTCLAAATSFAQAPSDRNLIEAGLPDAPSVTLEAMASADQRATESVSGSPSSPSTSAGAGPSAADSPAPAPKPDTSSSTPPISKNGDMAGAVEPPRRPAEFENRNIDWAGTANESFFFLSMQHGMRMIQVKTRRELDGRFFHDYRNAVGGLAGWGDGDSILTNYVGHPMMGAGAGWILIQNDPKGKALEFDPQNGAYWRSRLKAMGWSAIYSTQFEMGPISEASIGNVGRRRGTAGFVDLVMTPVGGFGWIVAEDAMDKHLIRKLEEGRSDGMKRFVRMFFSPNRTAANLFRLKKPWLRDGRRMDWDK